jgi:sterol desaturase/sphingolipid hydroxylase (fatty acid hydroxylase superfamily)
MNAFHQVVYTLLHQRRISAALDFVFGSHRPRVERFVLDLQESILPEEGRMRPLFVGTFVLIAMVSYAVTRGRGYHNGQLPGSPLPDPGSRRPRSVWAYIFPRAVYLHPSAIFDYKMYLANGLLRGFVSLTTLILSTRVTASATHRVLTLVLGARPPAAEGPPFWLCLLFTLALLAASDLGFFVAHVLEHKVPHLWAFHKVHHSAEVLTPVTVSRVHPVDKILEGALIALLAGVTTGIFEYGSRHELTLVLILGESAIRFFFNVLFNLRHSHIWMPYPRLVSHIFTSPAMHLVHHSAADRHRDTNFAAYFGLWDWALGTLYIPGDRPEDREFALGLSEGGSARYRSLYQGFVLPFLDLARQIRSSARKPPSVAKGTIGDPVTPD